MTVKWLTGGRAESLPRSAAGVVVEWPGLLCQQPACQNLVPGAARLQEAHQVQCSGRGLDIIDVQDRGHLLFVCM